MDLLLRRYGSIAFYMDQGWEMGFELMLKAYEQRMEQRAWERWLVLYPHMTVPHPMGTKPALEFVSFADYWDGLKAPPKKISTATTEEILRESEEIRRQIAERKKVT